ncbi:MAG: glycosyltransferase family 4 protein [Eubacteriales bacterium]|nr:glycosyltransferase family 4 protein [Eubacteriales bacterium]
MSKKILMIADVGSFWTKRYIENLLLPNGWDIVLFPIWDQTGPFDEYYREHGVTVYRDRHTLPVIRHIPRLRMWARISANARSLRRYGPFDVIHNHYLSQRDLALGGALRRAYPKAHWVCSFWGSDLLRSTGLELRRMRRYLAACDHITVHSSLHVRRVREVFGEAEAQKTSLVYFGQTIFADIDRVRATMDKAACKAHFGLPTDKPVICLGYNASPTHRHLQLLKGLQTLPDETLRGWTLVLQMTYGSFDDSYFATVRQAADAMPCHTLILTEFMDGTESATLRLAADAFVLAIPTDAFSASLQEYLYAGAQVLRASWLRYPQLDELSIETTAFSELSQVPALLTEALTRSLTPEEKQNRAMLKQKYSWETVSDGWLKLYE